MFCDFCAGPTTLGAVLLISRVFQVWLRQEYNISVLDYGGWFKAQLTYNSRRATLRHVWVRSSVSQKTSVKQRLRCVWGYQRPNIYLFLYNFIAQSFAAICELNALGHYLPVILWVCRSSTYPKVNYRTDQ